MYVNIQRYFKILLAIINKIIKPMKYNEEKNLLSLKLINDQNWLKQLWIIIINLCTIKLKYDLQK